MWWYYDFDVFIFFLGWLIGVKGWLKFGFVVQFEFGLLFDGENFLCDGGEIDNNNGYKV